MMTVCMRCVQVCDKIQTMNIWDLVGTGSRTTVNAGRARSLAETDCTFCGQCVTHCPVGALTARNDTQRVMEYLADPEIVTVVQVAPAVRVGWAEEFGLPKGTSAIGKMVAGLKALGFDYVFDTKFSVRSVIFVLFCTRSHGSAPGSGNSSFRTCHGRRPML